MKTLLSVSRVTLLALGLGTAGITATFAQTTNAPSATAPTCSVGGWHRHHHESVLTEAEKAQLKKAHDEALAANGNLQTEQAALKQQFDTLKSEGKGATTEAQWQALHQQKEDFNTQLRAAELSIDPTLAPIFAKLDAAHQGGHHHFDPSTSTTTAPST